MTSWCFGRGILIIPRQRQIFLLHLRRVLETLPVHLQFFFQTGLLTAQGGNISLGALDLGGKTDVSRVLRFSYRLEEDSPIPGLVPDGQSRFSAF